MDQELLEKKRKLFSFFIMIFAAMGGILYGYDIGVISGALLFMQRDISLTPSEVSFIVAAVLGGGSIATLISGPLADHFGRRRMISFSAIVVMIGTIILVISHSYFSVICGRLIQGIGIGIITIVIPLYLTEAISSSVRGRGVATFQLFLTGGILLAYLINLFFEETGNWRGMFLCVLAPGSLLFLGSLFLPESPSWLFFHRDREQAMRSLLRMRSEEETSKELLEMGELRESSSKIRWKRYYLTPLFMALCIACFNQLTGINVFLQFITVILKNEGLTSNLLSMMGGVGVGLMNFLMTILSLLLVDRLGRKPLLSIGTAGITVALLFAGFVAFYLPTGLLKGYLLMASLIAFVLFFALGPGVVVWLALSELLPTAIRSMGMALCLFVNSLTSTLLATFYLDLVEKIGYAGTFWLCAFFTFLYFLIACFFLPETKNRSLEEIENLFRNRDTR